MQLFVAGAFAYTVTPVEKVLSMLGDLQTKVEKEGLEEAKVYNEFACFCKERSAKSSEEIAAGFSSLSALNGELASLGSDRDDTSASIADTEADIKEKQDLLDAENAEWEIKLETFNNRKVDLKHGEHECEDAVKIMSASRSENSFAQLKSVALFADAIGLKSGGKVLALLQEPLETSKGGLQQTIDTVNQLDNDFIQKEEEVQRQFLMDKLTHEDVVQSLTGQLDAFKVTLNDLKKELAELTENIATSQKEATRVQQQALDDQKYLRELTDNCNSKSAEWHQRSQMRAEEVSTLAEAIGIVKTTVKEKADATSQSGHGQRVLLVADRADEADAASDYQSEVDAVVQRSKVLLQKAKDSSEPVAPQSFVQITKVSRHLRVSKGNPRDRVVELLNSKATQWHSQVLAEVAAQAAAGDPFAKIKTLIQSMVERLLEEAGADAEHEGWCNTEMEKTKQKRNMQADNVAASTEEIHRLEAERAQFTEEISTLGTELAELEDAMSQASSTRADEHSANEEAVHEATEGKAALDTAFDVLDHFYKASAKATVENLIQTQQPDAPAGGGSGAYKGDQSASKGILGMLEVIRSDFKRTIEETTKAEKKALAEFTEFMKVSKMSKEKKSVAKEYAENMLSETVTHLSDEVETLKEEQNGLNNAVIEWEKLRPACVSAGIDPAERKAAREDEIESLKQALCILADPTGAANC
jgi:predicted  nucleic acid-binding Zn-ribbon protein